MKHFITLSLFCFSLFMFSCTDPCADIVCGDNGVCDDGTCLCDEGYEGTACETEARAKYYGTFNGALTCPGEDPADQSIIFSAGPTVNQLLMADAFDPTFLDTLTLTGNIASSPVRDIDFLGIMITLQVDFTFTSEDQVTMMLNQTIDGQPFSCSGTLDRE